MTLDEAIQHCGEKACGNTACADEHRQLKAWLEELKRLRDGIIHRDEIYELEQTSEQWHKEHEGK